MAETQHAKEAARAVALFRSAKAKASQKECCLTVPGTAIQDGGKHNNEVRENTVRFLEAAEEDPRRRDSDRPTLVEFRFLETRSKIWKGILHFFTEGVACAKPPPPKTTTTRQPKNWRKAVEKQPRLSSEEEQTIHTSGRTTTLR